MEKSDAFLLCSRCEGFGRVTVEAMLMSKPIIATKSGGTIELIQEGYNGLLYIPCDFKELADKIKFLSENIFLGNEMGKNANNFAKNKFNKEVRPNLLEIKGSGRSVAFYRVDLNEWMDDYVNSTSRSKSKKGVLAWDKHQQEPKVFTSKVTEVDPLVKLLKEKEFLPGLAKLAKIKQKSGCTTQLNLKSEKPSVRRALDSCLASVQRVT